MAAKISAFGKGEGLFTESGLWVVPVDTLLPYAPAYGKLMS